MKKIPKLSICIPCFNEEKYIRECVESVLSQNFTDFVLNIVDDNSTDNTISIVEKIKDQRIVIHKYNTNVGLSQNWNRCLIIAKSPYIKILCADDVLKPFSLKYQVDILDEYKNVLLVFGANNIINASGKSILERKLFSENKIIKGNLLIKEIFRNARNILGEPGGIMFRRNVLVNNNLSFNKNYNYIADLDLWIKILKHGDGYFLNKEIFSFRIHSSSNTPKLLKKSFHEHLRLIKENSKQYNISLLERFIFYCRLIIFMFGKMIFVFIYAR